MTTLARSYNTQQQGLTVYSQVVGQVATCSIPDTWADAYTINKTETPLTIIAYRFSLSSGSGVSPQIRMLAAPYGTSLTDDNKIYPFGESLIIEYSTLATLKNILYIPENHIFKVQVKVETILSSPVIINMDFLSVIKTELYKIPT